MEYNLKKDYILQVVKTGITLEKAFILAEASENEIESLKLDKSFLRDLEVQAIIEEKRLLELFNDGMEIATSKGNTNPIQWRLSKLDPVRWGKGENTDSKGKDNTAKTQVYLPSNGR